MSKKLPATPGPLPKCERKNRFHWIVECQNTTENEKQTYRVELVSTKACDEPVCATRSQTGNAGAISSSFNRLQKSAEHYDDSPTGRKTVLGGT